MYMIIHPYLGYNNCPDNVLLIFTGKNKIKLNICFVLTKLNLLKVIYTFIDIGY